MKMIKRILKVLAAVLVLLTAFFITGRHGWKLFGFSVCESAGIEAVSVTENMVHIKGFYPGSFPQGFLGYHAEEVDGSLYVGFKFSGLFGIFETGDFEISIPVEGEITDVIVKTGKSENSIWSSEHSVTNANGYGIYIKPESSEIYSIQVSYDNAGSGVTNANNTAFEIGEYIYMDNDIHADAAGSPIKFTVSALTADGTVFATGSFTYDPMVEKMYLEVTTDGQIVDDTISVIPQPTESVTTLQAYATIIGEYYPAIAEQWDGQQLMDAGLNFLIADCYGDDPLGNIGYTVTDIDGDGTKELAIGTMSGDAFYGKMIFQLYTLDGNNEPMLLFSSMERDRWYYAGGIKFANLGSSSWNESYVTTLKLEDKEMVDMTYTTDPAEYMQMELVPFSQWTASSLPEELVGWKRDYVEPYTGTESKVFDLKSGDEIAVTMDRVDGRFDITIGQSGKKPIYTGNDVCSGAFTVTVPEDGNYEISVSGKNAKGSVSFSINQGEKEKENDR